MSLYITSLNSGSNGNCYYIANRHEAVLVDVGISCREVERRMARLGLNIKKVKAIFISHEHSDHIKGLRVLSKKHQLPVYITGLTQSSGGLQLEPALTNTFKPYEEVCIGDLKIKAFPKDHDCAEPHSFLVSGNEVTVGVFTDIGRVCSHVVDNFKQCHAVFLEANYDVTMLEEGRYPWYLKNRIRSGSGHLSNAQALDLFLTHRPHFMSHVLLSHLSRENNSPTLVRNLFREHAGHTFVDVASRDYETAVFEVNGQPQSLETAYSPVAQGQVSLF